MNSNVRVFYGWPNEVFSSILRPRIMPKKTGFMPAALLMAVLVLAHGFAAEPGRKNKETDDLFAGSSIPSLEIEVSPEGMEILRAYRFSINDEMERTNVLATIREGNRVYTNVALHLKGHLGSFQPVDSKPAFTLNFDKSAKGQRFHGLEKISLNNSIQDYSYVSEQVSRELFLSAGIPTPRASHAVVSLNGRALGLYVLLEGWNKQFLKRHFKNPDGNLYDGGAGKEITSFLDVDGDDPGNRTLLDILAAACKEQDLSYRMSALGQVLDMDLFFTFFALEIITADWDGYSLNKNNYRVYENPATGKLVFLPHGMDQMFGVWRMKPTSSITPMMHGLVSDAIIRTAEGRRLYLARMRELVAKIDADKLCARVDQLSARIRPLITDDTLRYQEQAAMQLKTRIKTRLASVREQLPIANDPVKFDSTGSYALRDWEFRRDSGSPGYSRRGNELRLIASGRPAYGSWRTLVRLGEGNYRLEGKVKLVNPEWGLVSTNRPGVTLRVSGERAATMITNAPGWQLIRYDFPVHGLADMEVVCEFRASRGEAVFDADSLRVIRRDGPEK